MSALPSDRVAIGLPGTDGGDGLTVIARNALGVDHTTPARMHREPAPDAFLPGTRPPGTRTDNARPALVPWWAAQGDVDVPKGTQSVTRRRRRGRRPSRSYTPPPWQ